MRRSAIVPVLVSVLVLVAAAMAAGEVSWAGEKYGGKIGIKLGAVPTVKTGASGEATFELGKDGGPVRYKLRVKNLENATMGHIHEVADNGTPGAILAWIYPTTGESPSLRAGKFSGTLAEGEVAADKLAGPLKGKTTKELFAMLESGKAGVAVHTKQNSGGEIWGVRNPMEGKK